MRAARIYGPAELIGEKINHLQVQACHGPAKGCLLGWGQRCHTLATQPRLGRACGRSDRGELRRSPRICPEQEGRYLGRRSAVKPLPCPSHRRCRTAWPDLSDLWLSRSVATASATLCTSSTARGTTKATRRTTSSRVLRDGGSLMLDTMTRCARCGINRYLRARAI